MSKYQITDSSSYWKLFDGWVDMLIQNSSVDRKINIDHPYLKLYGVCLKDGTIIIYYDDLKTSYPVCLYENLHYVERELKSRNQPLKKFTNGKRTDHWFSTILCKNMAQLEQDTIHHIK
jgi:hypothetical protein